MLHRDQYAAQQDIIIMYKTQDMVFYGIIGTRVNIYRKAWTVHILTQYAHVMVRKINMIS